jgi:predicted short-subunit dehydrogenase-like oxidoreductase (DUF2520 family)
VKYPAPSSEGSSSALPASPLDVAIVGAGRVGCSIGRALLARDHRIVAASVANQDSARRVLDALGHVPIVAPQDAPLAANVVVIAVPDDALPATVASVRAGLCDGSVVVHTSGIHGIGILAPCGENIAAIHPAQTIPQPSTDLKGVYFGVTSPEHMRAWSRWFVGELGGIPVEVPEERRALYHAALSMASNFMVALAGDSADLLQDAASLEPLMRQTIENVVRLGADAALTGPVVRGDAGTVRAHIVALTDHAPHLLQMYVANARRALERALKAGRLDAGRAKAVADALEEALVR